MCKNHKDERYVDHQAIVKNGEIIKNTDNFDIQKLIEQKNLNIASVS